MKPMKIQSRVSVTIWNCRHIVNYIFIAATQYIYDNLKKKDEQINVLTGQLGGFQKIDDSAENLRKAVQGCRKYTDDEVDKILTRLK